MSTKQIVRSIHRTPLLTLLALLLALSHSHALDLLRTYPPIAASPNEEQALLHHTNQARRNAGLPTLQHDEALALAARHHSHEMLELDYVAHESPRPENRSPRERAARAGAIMTGVGENLAWLSNPLDVGAQAVSGWLDSPGHRQNLLNPDFTHVGFGVARNQRGQVWITQVLGRKTLNITTASLHATTLRTPQLKVNFELLRPAEIIIWFARETFTPPTVFPAGRNSIIHAFTPTGPTHISGAIRAPTGDGFIGQDSGWLDPTARTWSPGMRSGREELLIESVQFGAENSDVWRVDFGLAAAPQTEFIMLVDGEPSKNLQHNGRNLQLHVPRTQPPPLIAIGQKRNPTDNSYQLTLQFKIETHPNGQPRIKLQ